MPKSYDDEYMPSSSNPLPERDPKRMAATRTCECYKCYTLIPPGVTLYDVGGMACCSSCYRKHDVESDANWPTEI